MENTKVHGATCNVFFVQCFGILLNTYYVARMDLVFPLSDQETHTKMHGPACNVIFDLFSDNFGYIMLCKHGFSASLARPGKTSKCMLSNATCIFVFFRHLLFGSNFPAVKAMLILSW